jgi:DNA-binding NarL/FixJ family response regulator
VSKTVSIVIVDDHKLVLDALQHRLKDEGGLRVVGTAEDGGGAIEQVDRHRPDIVVMDIDMPGLASFESARIISERSPGTQVIFLSAFCNDRYIEAALHVEAAGYVTKKESLQSVVDAIRAVRSGQCYFSPEVRARMVVGEKGVTLEEHARSRLSTLTPRELQILRYIARGLSRKEIAATIDLSLKTVECHCANLMSKLDIHDRVELTRFAIREELVEP